MSHSIFDTLGTEKELEENSIVGPLGKKVKKTKRSLAQACFPALLMHVITGPSGKKVEKAKRSPAQACCFALLMRVIFSMMDMLPTKINRIKCEPHIPDWALYKVYYDCCKVVDHDKPPQLFSECRQVSVTMAPIHCGR